MSAAERAELSRVKPKTVPQIALTAGDGGDLPAAVPLVEDHGADDTPAAVPGTSPETAPATPPAGPGTEHPEHKPVLSDEVEETHRRLRPEIGPRGESLNTDSSAALEAAIEKGQKDTAQQAAEAEAKALKDRAAVDKETAEKKTKGEKPATPTAEPAPAAAPAVPAEGTVAAPVEEEISDEELMQFLKPKAQQKILRRMRELKDVKEKLAAEEKKNKELAEKALAPEGDPKAKEELENLRTEAARLRRHLELESDPEITTKFDEPVAKAEATIADLLKNNNLSEHSLKTVQQAGGFAAFSHSDAKIPMVIDGETQEMPASAVAKIWEESLKLDDRALLQAKLGEIATTREAKKAFIAAEKAKAKEYFTKKAETAKKEQETVASASQKIKDDYDAWAAKTVKEDWLQDKPLPDHPTEEDKKTIAEYNQYTKEMRDMITGVDRIKSVKDFQEIVLSAAQFHHVRRDTGAEIRALKKQLADKDAELETLRSGLSTTGRKGSIRTAAAKPKEETKPKTSDPRMVDSVKALEDAMEAADRARTAGAEETE